MSKNAKPSIIKVCVITSTTALTFIAASLIPITRKAIYWNGCLNQTVTWIKTNEMNLKDWDKKAIESSKWCSVDPVCMEVAENGGQGPDSLNLGACHNCALVPETSCEAFNSYLDRAMLTGTVENKKMGYFN